MPTRFLCEVLASYSTGRQEVLLFGVFECGLLHGPCRVAGGLSALYRGLTVLGQDAVYGAVVCWTMPVLVAAMFAYLLTGLLRARWPRAASLQTPVWLGLALLANAWLVTNFFGLLGGPYLAAALGKAAVDTGVLWRWARAETARLEGPIAPRRHR